MDTAEKQAIEVGIPPEEGKFCADCKHLLGTRHSTEDVVNRWKCVHPNNLKEYKENIDLVTGLKTYIRIYFYDNIYDLRNLDDINLNDKPICGKEGNWYEKYKEPEYKRSNKYSVTEDNQIERRVEYKPQTVHPSKLKNLKLGTDL